ncbi:MAG: DUF3276 family protein, partial [Flavobacteriales bacterium]
NTFFEGLHKGDSVIVKNTLHANIKIQTTFTDKNGKQNLITESKKKYKDDGDFFYEKHKLFLYKEDFDKFKDGFEDVLSKISELRATGNYKEDNKEDYSSEVKFEDL